MGEPLTAVPKLPDAPSGWVRLAGQDFLTDAPLGQVANGDDRKSQPAGIYQDWVDPYPAAWQDNNGLAFYDYPRTMAVSGGVFEVWCHTEGGAPRSAAWTWRGPGGIRALTSGMAVEQMMRVTPSKYGAASIVWPTSDKWSEIEIDFPEHRFDQPPNAYQHKAGAHPEQNEASFRSTVDPSGWHSYRTELLTTGVRYLIDGQLIGETTVPITTPHRWMTQAGVHDAAQPPPATEESLYQVAWISFEQIDPTYTPGAPMSTTTLSYDSAKKQLTADSGNTRKHPGTLATVINVTTTVTDQTGNVLETDTLACTVTPAVAAALPDSIAAKTNDGSIITLVSDDGSKAVWQLG